MRASNLLHELCELVDNMADYYVQGITEPINDWLFEPTSASHADTIDPTSTGPDEGDETEKAERCALLLLCTAVRVSGSVPHLLCAPTPRSARVTYSCASLGVVVFA